MIVNITYRLENKLLSLMAQARNYVCQIMFYELIKRRFLIIITTTVNLCYLVSLISLNFAEMWIDIKIYSLINKYALDHLNVSDMIETIINTMRLILPKRVFT